MMNKDHNDLDKLAKQRLADLEYDFNPADWERLEKKLDRKAHLMPKLFWLKATEVSLMVLMVLSIYPFLLPKNTNTEQNSKSNTPIHANTTTGNTNANTPSSQLASTSQPAAALNQAQNKPNAGLEQANQQNSSPRNNNKNNSTSKQNKAGTNLQLSNGEANNNSAGGQTPNLSSPNAQGQAKAGLNQAQSLALNNTPSQTEHTTTAGAAQTLEPNQLSALWLPLVEPSFSLPSTSNPEPFQLQKTKITRPFRPRLYFTGLVGAEALSKTHHGDAKMGYFLGAWLDANVRAKWSIAGGLQIHRRQYNMLQTQTLSDSEGRQYAVRQESDTYVHLVQIPLSIRYNVLENKKWKVGVGLGLLSGFILHRNTEGQQSTTNQQSQGQVEISTSINDQAQDHGLFQGGQLGSNAFLAAGFQISGERQLTDRYALFIQPSFHYGLSTLSPWKDRVNNFALTVGLKTNITK
jgi:hypothetical protein